MITAPLSYGQRAMWFIQSLHPDATEYNLAMAWRVRADIDKAVLRRACQQLVDRHPILRTTYTVADGEPVQQVHATADAYFAAVDASSWLDTELHARLNQEAQRPFDLERGPIQRTYLFTRSANEHILLITCHHIASDIWTATVLLEELITLYQAEVAGVSATLLAPTLDYTGFVQWQRDLLASPEGEAHWQYWQAQLKQPPTLDLPTDRPRPAVRTNAGAIYPFQLDPELVQGLRTLARQEGVTLYTVLLAAFYVTLYRYSGQDDLVVGSPRYGRPPEGYDRTAGYFASPCALRVHLDGAMSFSAFLARVRQVLVGAKEHQDYPFPLVVERLSLARDPSRNAFFEVSFTYQKSHVTHLQGISTAHMGLPGAAIIIGGLSLESYPLERTTTKFDLDFMVEEVDGTLHAICRYSTDLWDRETIGRLVGHYQTLLAGAAANPAETLARLPLLSAAERHQLLVEWNDTAVAYPLERCLHHWIEDQVERTPHTTAVTFQGQHLTYRELNRRANQLAHYLQRQGVRPDVRVGLAMERSLEMVVGLLGVLKSGGAYVPIDPTYPRDRLVHMISDSQVPVLLTQAHLVAELPEHSAEVLCLDFDWDDQIGQEPETNPISTVGPDNLAYMIYTSGSTGKPKGAMNNHRGICNRILWMQSEYQLTPADRVLQKTPFSFDVSVWEFFWPLMTGACMVLAKPEGHKDPGYLTAIIQEEGITTVHFVPSMLQFFLEADDVSNCTSIRQVMCSGEALPYESQERFFQKLAKAELHNLYGPTEAAVDVTYWACERGSKRKIVPIGRPVANTQMYVLDAQLHPVPIGVAGELHIGGVQVGRGYLNRPELTTEKFIPDLFRSAPGAKLYKTGDLARYLPDGSIDYLGRLDNQVKIRGLRIELGEIESVLREHPAVEDAAVMARTDASGDKRLVGYVVPTAADAASVADLRAHLKTKLPEYMVPSFFVFVDQWPVSPNGKLDRKALPELKEWSAKRETVAPQSGLERQIAAIWQEVLGVSVVGIDDNFFEIGGHSLGIIKVENKLKQMLGLSVSTMDLFRAPTIRQLAQYLNRASGTAETVQGKAPTRPRPTAAPEADIAIVGMAGRFPGAQSVDEFWANLVAGKESIIDLTEEDLMEAGVDPNLLRDQRYVKRKGVLDGVEYFDAPFFGYPPREAQLMDPQQRLFLELAWQALEHAGHGKGGTARSIGVFGGTGKPGYLLHHLETNPEAATELFQTMLLNDKDFLSTRLAYKLNLRGPALTVQTACSTSLVAVHLACHSVARGECDMALAGGVALEVPHGTGYLYQEGHILSPDGRCRAFDVNAKGTVRGSGGAMVVLKRLADAQADGDTIWAVIKGSALNNDGAQKVGYTAPSVEGQAEVIAQALDQAGIDPRTIGFVEAHGTGTPLGDPIEVAALTQAYRRSTPDRGYCGIGSVKTNVGHLDAAAGVTGLIKAALALHHRLIPPTLHFTAPNPKLDLPNSPFFVNSEPLPWRAEGRPRRAAVSSFGIGGTNAHVILEEAPAAPATRAGRPYEILTLSAKTPTALDAMTAQLAQHLQAHPDLNLADVAYTLQVGRASLPCRRMVVGTDAAEAAEALKQQARGRVFSGSPAANPSVVFLFPGQGLQQVNMGRELYETEPEFRRYVDECAQILEPVLGFDLRTVIYPALADAAAAAERLAQTAVTQPAIFVVEYALAKLLMAWGVRPAAMMGHSLGEYVAACLAGVISLPDALRLVAARGQLVQGLPQTAGMLAVELSPAALQPWLSRDIELAVVNAPDASVVAGPAPAIEALQATLKAQGINCQRVRTSHAFHSAQLDPILPAFLELVRGVPLMPPQIPYITNVTGTWVTPEQAANPAHWVQHMRGTVRFAAGLREIMGEADSICVEVGPGQSFTGLIQRHPERDNVRLAVPTLGNQQQKQPDLAALLTALGRMWLAGVPVDWMQLHAGEQRRRVPLPAYPFDRHRYWMDARPPVVSEGGWITEVAAANQMYTAPTGMMELRAEVSVDAPRDEVELELAKIYEEVLGITPVGVNESFFALGGTSLSALSVISRIERVFGRSVPTAVLLEGQTVEALARVLREDKVIRGYELVGIQTTGTLPPIFCLHPYGGHVTNYFPLARALGPDQPVYGLQARGLQGETTPHTRIEEMAADYIRTIKSKQPFGPYFLVGHSMGGNIAYEMARQLEAAGEEVGLLALIDAKARSNEPQPLYRLPKYVPVAANTWLSDEAAILGHHFRQLQVPWEQLRDVAQKDQWLYVLDAAVSAGLVPEGAHEQIQHVITVTKANDEALRAYVPQAYDGPVVLFSPGEGFAHQFGDEQLGWTGLARGLERVLIAGDHRSVMDQPNVELLAEPLKARLAACYQHLRSYWARRLGALSGRPARVTLPDGSMHLGTYYYDAHGGAIDRLALPNLPHDVVRAGHGSIAVEIITSDGLLRFDTTPRGDDLTSRRIPIELPDEVEAVQRRSEMRVEVDLPVFVQVDGRRYSGQAFNLSAGGAAIRLEGPWDSVPGAALGITFADPARIGVSELAAREVRVGQRDGQAVISVQFQGHSAQHAERLASYCRWVVAQQRVAQPDQ